MDDPRRLDEPPLAAPHVVQSQLRLRRGTPGRGRPDIYRVFARLTVGCRCILNRIRARVPMVTVPIW